ncbi:MAG: hypothetical protein ACP5JC_04900, partial [Candidatus Micrarchaeia archaeon]
EEGRKWKYYELTQKGRKLISPERKPITAVIMLIVGLLLIGYAFFVFPYPAEEENAGVVLNKMEGQQGGEFGVAKAFTEEQPAIEETHDNGFVQMMLAFAGLVLLIAGSLNLRKSSKL